MSTFHVLGYPRVGAERELKWALESYWRNDITQESLWDVAKVVREDNWQAQLDAGCELLTVGDFCLYDHVLNTSFLLGHLPRRVNTTDNALDRIFLAARGRAPTGTPVHACEMTKWFDTNYHYLIPEFHAEDAFSLNAEFLLEEVRAAKQLSSNIKVALPGPLTYLWLGQSKDGSERLEHLDAVLDVYADLLCLLKEEGVSWVQLDEPALVTDLPLEWVNAYERAYHRLRGAGIDILLATYFGGVGEHLSRVFQLPVQGVHLDMVSAPEQLSAAVDQIGPYKVLSLGVIDGRNIWRADIELLYQSLKPIQKRLKDRLWVGTSCSLLHVPYRASTEQNLADGCEQWLSFAEEKLQEGVLLSKALNDETAKQGSQWLDQVQRSVARQLSKRVHKDAVKQRVVNIAPTEWHRPQGYNERQTLQQRLLNLPLFPTTTIGSFPQTQGIRKLRRDWRDGKIDVTAYELGLKDEIQHCIRIQEDIGLDVLVHGEAERNDMVEYFGELLDGIAVSAAGWVQSYGSRCVKPPIIYGDIERPSPMTVRWTEYAQSQTNQPVKAMLTGPVTMLKWAFVRNDQPWSDTAYQLAAVLHDEVQDLEAAGIHIIQIDEPALREALPLRRAEHKAYLNWAVNSFRYCYADTKATTQLHTHMCYADFDDILEAIQAMDADVITLETARSASALLNTLERKPYTNGIGPGVYDIHSPNIPEANQMEEILTGARSTVKDKDLWVNPDCGLKTRRWEEVIPALKAMVGVARKLRAEEVSDTSPVTIHL